MFNACPVLAPGKVWINCGCWPGVSACDDVLRRRMRTCVLSVSSTARSRSVDPCYSIYGRSQHYVSALRCRDKNSVHSMAWKRTSVACLKHSVAEETHYNGIHNTYYNYNNYYYSLLIFIHGCGMSRI